MDTPELPYNRDLTYIGQASFRNKNQIFGIKRKDRRQHVYVLGKSGTGKSVLLSNMIIQNINNGEGVAVVDPHGELVEGILAAIPPHRVKDVIYFNPADIDYHIGFNVLELLDPKYKHLVASGLMGIFTKIWANAWSARMEYILNNAILALLDTPGSTLLGIPRMLVDKDFRQKIINNLKDPVIKAFWIHEYEAWQDKFRNEAIAPIQNKVGQFLSTSIIRNVVGQSKSTIDFFDIMNSGKIFLVNVSKGRIGEDNSALLGGMIITKIQLAAMERVRIPENERKDFYLYVDEFQNFVTDSFASILSEARKYRLNLTVAHQYTAQLVTENGSAVRDAVFGNVGTMIIFRVGADDADFLEKEFEPEFVAQDIVNLPNYRVYLKLMIDGVTSRPFSARTLPPMAHADLNVEKQVIEMSRNLYTRSKEVIEKEINDWSGMALGDNPGGSTAGPTGEKFPVICSNCMKETFVPFKPEEGRPVYCKDCIAKMKTGELKPAKGSARQIKYDEASFFKPLADLGIEFVSKDSTNIAPKSTAERGVTNIPKPGFVGAVKKVFQNTFTPKTIPPKNNFNPNPNVPRPQIKKEEEKPKENLALKEILGKVLNDAIPAKPKAEETHQTSPQPSPEKARGPEPISLSSLKTENPMPVSANVPVKDTKSASEEDKNTLKDLLLKINSEAPKVEEVKKEPEIIIPKIEPKIEVKPEIKIPEIKVEPPKKEEVKPIDPPVQSNTNNSFRSVPLPPKEVPEDVLRKILEE